MAKKTVLVLFFILFLILFCHQRAATLRLGGRQPDKNSGGAGDGEPLVRPHARLDEEAQPEINGVDGSESNPINTTDPDTSRVLFGDELHFVDPPGHSFQAIREQIFGSNNTSALPPPMNGFAQQAFSMDPNMPQSVMNGFHPDKIFVGKTHK
ncbi:Phosphatidylglycerol/phosphatidylinositol transfer protein [Orobanche minor]